MRAIITSLFALILTATFAQAQIDLADLRVDVDIDQRGVSIGGSGEALDGRVNVRVDREYGIDARLLVAVEGNLDCRNFIAEVNGDEVGQFDRGQAVEKNFHRFNPREQPSVQLVCIDGGSPFRGLRSRERDASIRSWETTQVIFRDSDFRLN